MKAAPAPGPRKEDAKKGSAAGGLKKEGRRLRAQPRRVSGLWLSQLSWGDLAGNRESRTLLQLRCLPPGLCSPGTLEATLRSHGIAATVEKVKVAHARGKSFGLGVVRADSPAEVQKIVKAFHGRLWDSALPVSVSFIADEAARGTRGSEPLRVVTDRSLADSAVEPARTASSSSLPTLPSDEDEGIDSDAVSTQAGSEGSCDSEEEGTPESPLSPPATLTWSSATALAHPC